MLPFVRSPLRLLLAISLLPGLLTAFRIPTSPPGAAPPPPVTLFLPLAVNSTVPGSDVIPPDQPPLTQAELAQVLAAGQPAADLAAQALGRRILVTTPSDDLASNGNCTLREAVQAANTDRRVDACPSGRGFDVIVLPSGTYTLTLDQPGFEDANAWGDLDLHASAVLFGEGPSPSVISGNNSDRPLDVFPGVDAVLFRIALIRGSFTQDDIISSEDYDFARGAGLRNAGRVLLALSGVAGNYTISEAGGVYNTGVLGLFRSSITGNNAELGGGGGLYSTGDVMGLDVQVDRNWSSYGNGGALYNTGRVVLAKARFERNSGDVYRSFGGVIYNSGGMTLTETLLEDGLALFGGSIYNTGVLSLHNVTVTNSSTRGPSNGAIWNEGTIRFWDGAIRDNNNLGLSNHGLAELHKVLVSNNRNWLGYGDGMGGGISNRGWLTMTQSTVAGNNTEGIGGGIWNGGSLWAIDSTISNNFAEDLEDNKYNGLGGGIYSLGPLTLVNVTLSGNRASHMGGGLYLENVHARLMNVDVVSNTVLSGEGGGIVVTGTVPITVAASLIAANFDPSSPPASPDCFAMPGLVQSLGYNLLGDPSGCAWPPAPGDLTGAPGAPLDPHIGSLADNGGPTLTHALLPGSPAIDAAGPACLPYDQRGVPRPQGPACDIGAYELGP